MCGLDSAANKWKVLSRSTQLQFNANWKHVCINPDRTCPLWREQLMANARKIEGKEKKIGNLKNKLASILLN